MLSPSRYESKHVIEIAQLDTDIMLSFWWCRLDLKYSSWKLCRLGLYRGFDSQARKNSTDDATGKDQMRLCPHDGFLIRMHAHSGQ